MDKINIFIAKTPLQLFNSIEAKNRFHKNETNILFYQYNSSVDREQIESLIVVDEWQEIYPYKLKFTNKIFFIIKTNKLIKKYKNKISNCYYGTYNTIIRYMINKINPFKSIIIDDGVKTLDIARLVESKTIKKSFFRDINNKIFYSGIDFMYKSSFFTLYDLSRYNISNEVIKNDYRVFISYLKNIKKEDVVYFIGTNLNQRCLKNPNLYEEYIKNIREYYKKKKLIYVLHRYESINFIKPLAEKYNFEFVKFNTIIEVEISKAIFLPSEIATFASSAIDSLPLIYKDTSYKVFELKADDIKEERQAIFENLYLSFKKKGLDVISL